MNIIFFIQILAKSMKVYYGRRNSNMAAEWGHYLHRPQYYKAKGLVPQSEKNDFEERMF